MVESSSCNSPESSSDSEAAELVREGVDQMIFELEFGKWSLEMNVVDAYGDGESGSLRGYLIMWVCLL